MALVDSICYYVHGIGGQYMLLCPWHWWTVYVIMSMALVDSICYLQNLNTYHLYAVKLWYSEFDYVNSP